MNEQQTWQSILNILEAGIPKAYFNTWLKSTTLIEQSGDTMTIGVPSNYHRNWIAEKYQNELLAAIKRVTPEVLHVQYKVGTYAPISKKSFESTDRSPENIDRHQVQQNSDLMSSGLNPTYKFEMFITGKNNELAHAASLAVASNPGTNYNPLFIYGGVGLGKTHLMQAVGHRFLQDRPKASVLYVTCEKFTNDYINSIKNQKTDDFKRRYRSVDMLLIDDIQFIAGKEQTQEEFFHTFNELRDRSRQIILTADRLPKDIQGIEQRLISRFEWGMVTDIQAPDLEMRMAILKSKIAKRGAHLPQDIILYLAEQIQTNVRELEGALNRILVFQDMQHQAIGLEQAKNLLTSVLGAKKKALSIKKIATITAEFYNVTLDDLLKQSRRKEFVTPRQIAMFLARKEMNTSLPTIGEFFGGRDHTTVLHAVEKLEREIEKDSAFKQQLDLLVEKLYNT